MRAQAIAIVTLMAMLAAPLGAQDRTRETAAWRALAGRLQPGTFVDIRTKDGGHFKGTFLESTDDRVLVKPHTRVAVPAREVAFAELESMTPAKHGMSPGMKVLIGVGASIGSMMLLMAALVAASY